MSHSRRDFLVRSTCAAIGAAAFQGFIRQFGLANLLAQEAPVCGGGYKALVCVFLAGGNDGNNMVVPTYTNVPNQGYNAYSAARGGLTLALPSGPNTLLALNPAPPSMGGQTYAFHPSFGDDPVNGYSGLASLFNQGKLAVVTNVGSLVHPMSQAQYMNNSVQKPYALFSHSDQVQAWQTARADVKVSTGWGGRMADSVLSCNAGAGLPTMTSISGASTFCIGALQRPLAIGTGALNTVLVLNGFNNNTSDNARKASMNYLRTIDNTAAMIAGASSVTQQGVDVSSQLAIADPTINTVFPTTSLGNQLKQVAKIIKLNSSGGLVPAMTRQIFFVSQGGYDTHQDQLSDQGGNFTALSLALGAFYQATVNDIGLQNSVTTFTLSDFGRTLQSSGSGSSIGSDHGWGNHQFVIGGAVLGGDFYGNVNPATSSRFPMLTPGSPDDTTNNMSSGRGRWIPATSVDEYATTLAKWLGVGASDIPSVFPLIGNMASPSGLGFLP